jgi:hypothetical protein
MKKRDTNIEKAKPRSITELRDKMSILRHKA